MTAPTAMGLIAKDSEIAAARAVVQ